MDNLVIMKNQQAVTTSLQVAETFNKNHRDVLAAIDEITQGYFTKIAIFIHKTNKNIDKSL